MSRLERIGKLWDLGSGRRVAVAAAAAVLGVAAVVGAAAWWRGGDGASAEQPSPVGGLEAVALPELVEPAEGLPPLPANGVVGEGALIYACRNCGATLALPDGTQFGLTDGMGPATLAYSLSPDGRWLTVPDPDGIAVRDLTGSQLWQSAAVDGRSLQPWAWSPDSRWLLVGDIRPAEDIGAPSGYRLLDLFDGTELAVAGQPGRDYVAVSPDGLLWTVELTAAEDGPGSSAVEVTLVDPASPGPGETLTIDATDWLEPGESLVEPGNGLRDGVPFRGGVELLLAPGGDGFHVGVFSSEAPVPSAVLRVDRRGLVQQRLDIRPDNERAFGWLAGQYGGAPVLALAEAMSEQVAFAIVLYAVTDAGLRELSRMAPAALVRIPGTAANGGSAF